MKNQEQMIKDIMEFKWEKMETKIPFMSAYLHNKEILEGYNADDVLNVMSECLTMLFGELNNKLGKLNKYEPKHYTDSDFVDMVIESIGEDILDKSDKEASLKYVEDFRITLWGHTNYHADKYIKLYTGIMEKISAIEKSYDILRESMTIIMVECLLRIIEKKIFEKENK